MRRALLALMASLALFGCSSDELDDSRTPNILIVLVDELRADALGVSGHAFFQSPCIDRIADEGVRFDQAFVVTSLCSPSRATILSGLHTPQHGVLDIWTEFDPDMEHLGTILGSAGYETAFVGKSHLNETGDPLRGFDRWLSFAGQGEYIDPILNVDGESEQRSGHMTDLLTEEALRFLDERNRRKPFFMILSHLAAHRPWIPQAHFDGLYDGQSLPAPSSWDDDFTDQPAWLACRQLANYDGASYLGYYEMLAGVEESICQLLASLEASADLDDTLVIFTSDNGYFLGEHRLGDKRAAYEESIRIPLLVRYPRWFPAGSEITESLALNLDVAPTVLRAAGIDVGTELPGKLLQDLADGSARRDRFLYLYYQDLCSTNPTASCTPSMAGIRTLDHILVDYPSPRTLDELYDLRSDPHQMNNRIQDPAWSALADSLLTELNLLRAEFNAD